MMPRPVSGVHGAAAQRPLTVGYVLKMFPRFSETFILNEILELERRGLRIVVFSMKSPDETLRQPRVAELKSTIRVIPPLAGRRWEYLRLHLLAALRHPKRYWDTWRFARARGTRAAWQKFLAAPFIVHHARRQGVEHFHAHFASGPARQAKLAAMLSGIPFSFTAHAKDLYWKGHNHGHNNKLKKRVVLAAFVITISEYNRRFIESLNFKAPRRRIVTVYNALDPRRWPFLRPAGRPTWRAEPAGSAGRPLILAVGRLVPKKGFDVLIHACALLRARGSDVGCLIAGEGPERPRLEALIAELGLQDTVALPGSIRQDQLLERYYREAVVLVQPSIVDADGDQDGIPTVILEALAVGVPVVATDVSGIREAVLPDETGLLVPPGDAAALALAMSRILGDDHLAGQLAQRGRLLFEDRFNLLKNAKVLIHLMRVSARGEVRWSLPKLRERAGVMTPAGEGAGSERLAQPAPRSVEDVPNGAGVGV